MRASPDQWTHHEGAPSIYRQPREVRLAHIRHTKKGFPSCMHTTVLTHSRHQRIPSNTSRNIHYHDISVGALRKETLASPKRAIGSRPKHTSSRRHSRHYIVNAEELGLIWWVDKYCMVRHWLNRS